MSARVCVLDIERVAATVEVWDLAQKGYISPDSIISPSRTICLAWKWLDKPKIHFAAEWQKGHESMIQQAHEVLDEATHVVGWNSQAFDMKHLRSHFLQYGMKPPSPHVDVDLLKVMRKNFQFMSNRLAYVSSVLGLDGKAEHHGLWKDLRSDKKGVVKRAQQQMAVYNKRDIELTEEMYYLLQPWVSNLNLHTFEDPNDVDAADPKCPNCTSANLQRRGKETTRTRVYQRYQCQDCGKWAKGTKSMNSVEVAGI